MEHKRHSSVKPGRSKKSGRFVTAVFIILSVALAAGILVLSPLGDYLSENVFPDLLSCCERVSGDQKIVSALKQQENLPSVLPTQPKASEKAHEVITIEETPFYILQMGAFTEKANAVSHAEEIRRLGAGGAVFQDGSVYRVFAAAYLDEASLMKVHAQVRGDGFEASPYITDKKGLKITLDGDKEAVDAVRNAVRIMNGIPTDLCRLCLSFDKGEAKEADICNALQAHMTELETGCSDLGRIRSEAISPILSLLKIYRENISTFLSEHDTIDVEILSGDLKYLQLSVIIDYILFFDQE